MLKEENSYLKEGAIIGVKFMSGEDIMTKVGKISDGVVELLLPHALISTDEGPAFMAWPSMINDEPLLVDADKIMLAYPLREDFHDQYAPMHDDVEDNGGIIMPAEKRIVT